MNKWMFEWIYDISDGLLDGRMKNVMNKASWIRSNTERCTDGDDYLSVSKSQDQKLGNKALIIVQPSADWMIVGGQTKWE